MNEILVGLLGVFATVIAGLVAAVVTMVRSKRPTKNPPDPEAVRAGQMAVSYWLREFDRMHTKMDEMVTCLREIQKELKKGRTND